MLVRMCNSTLKGNRKPLMICHHHACLCYVSLTYTPLKVDSPILGSPRSTKREMLGNKLIAVSRF
jgi:hypothetical protein